jgi:indole-3-acetate monooxygenase
VSEAAISASASEYLARARSVAQLIETEADATERLGTMTKRVFEGLSDTELFWLLLPSEYGGGQQGIVSYMEVIEELSRADASTGWSLMANATAIGAAAGFLDDVGAEILFGGAKKAIIAGQLAPMGTGIEVDNGFEFSGHYQFGSGCNHSSWMGGGFSVIENGKPRTLENGEPDMRVAFVPREQAEFLGNWDVTGLVGTGSFDYKIPQQFVRRELTFERLSLEPHRKEPVFSLGIIGIGVAGHTGVVLGLMKRALEEVVQITADKRRVGYSTAVGDHPMFLHQFSIFEASYQAARTYAIAVFREAESTAAAGRVISDEQRARIRQVSTWTHNVASEVTAFCHLWGGTQAFRNPSVLGRVGRDMGVATQHVLIDPVTLAAAGSTIVGSWRGALLQA